MSQTSLCLAHKVWIEADMYVINMIDDEKHHTKGMNKALRHCEEQRWQSS